MESREKQDLIIEFLDNLKETTRLINLDKNGVSMIAGMMIDVGKVLKDGDDEKLKKIIHPPNE